MGLLAFNGSQFSGLVPCRGPSTLEPSLLPWRNSERERQVQPKSSGQHLCLQYYPTAIIGSYCGNFHSEAIGHVPIWSPTILLGLEIRITLTSFTTLSLSHPTCNSPDHLSPFHLFCNEAPLFPWSGPLESRRSSNGSSYSRHGHCAGQPREEACEVQQSAT